MPRAPYKDVFHVIAVRAARSVSYQSDGTGSSYVGKVAGQVVRLVVLDDPILHEARFSLTQVRSRVWRRGEPNAR